MINRIILSVVLVCCFVINAFAQSELNITKQLETWLSSMSFKAATANSFEFPSDVKLFKGMQFNVTRDGQTLINPVTKKVIGSKTSEIGTATIIDIKNNIATVSLKPIGNNLLEVGDNIILPKPLNVAIDNGGLNSTNALLVNSYVFNTNGLVDNATADYTMQCDLKNDVIDCAFTFRTNVVFNSEITKISEINLSLVGDDLAKEHRFTDKFVSVAIGNPYGDNNIYVAMATKNKVMLYTYDKNTNQLSPKHNVTRSFDDIVNIELFDVDNDGKDEIYVSNIKDNEASSYILKADGTAFKAIVERDKTLYRTYISNGKKHLISQGYGTGNFAGYVNSVNFVDGKYVHERITSVLNIRLYGFGQYDIDGNGNDDIIGFDNNGFFFTAADGKTITTYKDTYFGDTSHKIIHSTEVQIDTQVLTDGNEVPVYDTHLKALSVYQRIIELDDGKFLMSNNFPIERQALAIDTYNKSDIALYMFFAGGIHELENTKISITPAIYEADALINERGALIVLLSSDIDEEQNFSSAISVLNATK